MPAAKLKYVDDKGVYIYWNHVILTRKNETIQSILVNKYNSTFISDKTAFNGYIGNEYIMVNKLAIIQRNYDK